MPKSRRFLRCTVCGVNAPYKNFTRGALGHAMQALTQTFVGRGGDNGGAFIWDRRPMVREELEHVAQAVVTASHELAEKLDGDLPEVLSPQQVLSSLLDVDFNVTADAWVKEAEEEMLRRRQIVEKEREWRSHERTITK